MVRRRCGPPPLGITRTARRRTTTSRRAQPRWRRSRRVGGGSSAGDKPSRRAGSASCAGLGRRVHHPVGRSGGHIRACPHSLVASRIIAGRAKGLPAIPNLASAMQGAGLQLLINAQIGGPLSGAKQTWTKDGVMSAYDRLGHNGSLFVALHGPEPTPRPAILGP